jgi:hypothetical protein
MKQNMTKWGGRKEIEGKEEEGNTNFNHFINNRLKVNLFFHLYLEKFQNVIFS